MRLSDFDVLSFDCYGTLIDWEAGILAALEPLRARTARRPGDDEALQAFARRESARQAETPDLLYPKILAEVHGDLARLWDAEPAAGEAAAFGAAVPDWPAFADSPASLGYLKRHYKLAVLSNVDRASFAASNARLGVAFDLIVTAEDVGSYKPDPANFDALLAALAEQGIDKSRVLHTAQSLFHDHLPANRAGLATAWIDRRHGRDGWGATMAPATEPRIDVRAESLADLVARHETESGG